MSICPSAGRSPWHEVSQRSDFSILWGTHAPYLCTVGQACIIEFFGCMQMAVEDGQVQANVHITPMRASRALALRYLATKFSTDTENIAVSLSCRDSMHFS